MTGLDSVLPTVLAATEGAEEEGGSFLVSPDVGLMIWTLLIVGLSLLILQRLAFPRITEALDKRQKAIEDSIDIAERTRTEADQLLAEYRERLTAARAEADEIITRARKAAEEAQKASHSAGESDRQRQLEQAKRDIQAETQRALAEIRSEVTELTVLATEKVTRKALTDADQRRLVEEAIGELDFSALAGEGR